jgi:hypothetical protein
LANAPNFAHFDQHLFGLANLSTSTIAGMGLFFNRFLLYLRLAYFFKAPFEKLFRFSLFFKVWFEICLGLGQDLFRVGSGSIWDKFQIYLNFF